MAVSLATEFSFFFNRSIEKNWSARVWVIEDGVEETDEGVNTGAPGGGTVIETIGEIEPATDVAAGPSVMPRSSPVVLQPARPEPTRLMRARPKPQAKSTTTETAKETPTVPKEKGDDKASSSSTTPKMTTEVNDVSKRQESKARPTSTSQTAPEQPTPSSNAETSATYAVATPDVPPIHLTDRHDNPIVMVHGHTTREPDVMFVIHNMWRLQGVVYQLLRGLQGRKRKEL